MSDLIDRQAAIKWVKTECNPYGSPTLDSESGKKVIEHLKRMPPAHDPVKHGKWEMKPDPYGFFEEIPVCSECGCTTKMRQKYRYCPNCGARMDGGKE